MNIIDEDGPCTSECNGISISDSQWIDQRSETERTSDQSKLILTLRRKFKEASRECDQLRKEIAAAEARGRKQAADDIAARIMELYQDVASWPSESAILAAAAIARGYVAEQDTSGGGDE